MKEYTEIKVSNLEFPIEEILKIDALLYFQFQDRKIGFSLRTGKLLSHHNSNIFTFETQGFYAGLSLKEANKGLEVGIYKDARYSIKIGDGIIEKRLFKKAKKESWKIDQKIELNNSKEINVNINLSEEAKSFLEFGSTPLSMDDKWFIYVKDEVIHFIRSWTGIEVFQAEILRNEDSWQIQKLLINTNEEVKDFSNPELFETLIKSRILTMKRLINGK